MKLEDFTNNTVMRLNRVAHSLRENFDYEINFHTMTPYKAHRVKQRIKEQLSETQDLNHRLKLQTINEALSLWEKANEQDDIDDFLLETLDDRAVESAKVVIAAQEMSDKIQGMIEDTAKMQVQDLIPISDAMRSEIGVQEAKTFSDTVDEVLGELLDALKHAKEEMENAIAVSQGVDIPNDMENFNVNAGDDEMDDDIGDIGDENEMPDINDDEMDDGFGGSPGNIEDDEPTGRKMKDGE